MSPDIRTEIADYKQALREAFHRDLLQGRAISTREQNYYFRDAIESCWSDESKAELLDLALMDIATNNELKGMLVLRRLLLDSVDEWVDDFMQGRLEH